LNKEKLSMRVTELCPSPHLEPLDIGDRIGDERVLTIAGVDVREVGSEKVRKGVLLFKELDRGMVLNRTNSRTIATLHGSETKEWKGKKITLYRSETPFQGKIVSCLRVRETKPE
jgi:hypothetical protein